MEIIASHFIGKNITLLRLNSEYCNTLYKFFVSGERTPFVLKFFTRDPSAYKREADVSDYLSKDIPVPKILVSGCANTPIPYVIYEWVEGKTLDTLLTNCCGSETEQVGFAIGVILAKLTYHRFENCGLFGEKLKYKVAKLLDLAHLCRIASTTTRPYTTRVIALQLIKDTLVLCDQTE